jgi:3-hydroxyisobutyrate dehydrogenase-like beta-hydroxyacid dehydrogenase
MKLGFVGIGRMGEPMVLRLRSANFPVVVWNRTRTRLAAVVAAGAEPVDTLPELATPSSRWSRMMLPWKRSIPRTMGS